MDPVADALIRIKNGYSVGRVSVEIKYSKLILKMMQLLKAEGYLEECKEVSGVITVTLKYNGRKPAVADVKRVSRPSLRVYKGVSELPRVLNGLGIAIISTPKGLMTEREAKKQKVGGEILAFVW